jgi:hypothetical protein
MPQPLSRVAPGAGMFVGSNSASETFRQYPSLAVLAMEAIATWSLVEYSMLELFIELAGGSKEKAGAIYLALEIQSAKAAAVAALICDCKKEHRDLFYCINDLRKSRKIERDKLAHWMWGRSNGIKDGFLLCDPKNLISAMEPFRTVSVNLSNIATVKQSVEDTMFVYKEKDFSDMIAANQQLSEYFAKFQYVVSFPPLDLDNTVYESLLAEPAIADTARRRAARGQIPPTEAL